MSNWEAYKAHVPGCHILPPHTPVTVGVTFFTLMQLYGIVVFDGHSFLLFCVIDRCGVHGFKIHLRGICGFLISHRSTTGDINRKACHRT